MKVSELIKELKTLPQDIDVCVEHTEFMDCFIGIGGAIKIEDEDEEIALLQYEF